MNKLTDGFKLYPAVDSRGAVTAPEEIGDLMSQIEFLISSDILDEEYMAIYDTISRILTAPAVLLQQTCAEILQEIIEFNTDETTTEEEEDTNMGKHRRGFGNRTNNACDLPSHADDTKKAGEVEILDKDDDISDEELLAEYGEKPERLHED